MRVFFQIFIIVFVILSLFIVKDDVISVYNRAVNYIDNNILKSNNENQIIQKSDSNLVEKIKTISTPGALRVVDSLLTTDSSLTNLSAKNVINLTNKERKDNGNLVPLKENSKLDFSAEKKLQDMFMKQYFEHVSPSGVGVSDLANEVGYEYIIIGENLALGNFKDDQSLLDAWMASPGHRANILNNKYKEIGVAVGKATFEGRNVWIAVQHFGLPISACPTIDEVLKGVIILNQQRVKIMESDLLIRKSNIDSGAVYEGLTTIEQIYKYNSLVTIYNDLINETKDKINQYNNQVEAFNSCVSVNT